MEVILPRIRESKQKAVFEENFAIAGLYIFSYSYASPSPKQIYLQN
jgi:hypothetical protein